jgi:CHAT domain-containing protein/Tfp pilus assembly protein PilF
MPDANEEALDAWINAAKQAYQRDDLVGAETACLAGIQLAETLHNQNKTATLLINLGPVYVQRELWEQALQCYSRAQAIYETNDPEMAAEVMNRMGIIYDDLGRLETALEYHIRALKVREDAGTADAVPRGLNCLGNTYYGLGQLDQAHALYERALKAAETEDIPIAIAYSLNNLGNVFNHKGAWEKALEYHKRALKIKERHGRKAEVIESLGRLASLCEEHGLLSEAEEYLKRSIRMVGLVGRRPAPWIYNLLGNICRLGGRLQEAIVFHNQALTEAQASEQREACIISLNHLGLAYDEVGQWEQGLECHNRALVLAQQSDDPEWVADTLNRIGNIYDDTGQYNKALEAHTQSLDIRKTVSQAETLALGYNSLGNLYHSLGQWDKALDLYRRAVTAAEEQCNEQAVAFSLNNLGNALSDNGATNEAWECYSRALAINEKLGNRSAQANNLLGLGNLCGDQDQTQEAIVYYTRALSIQKEMGNSQATARSLQNLGNIYFYDTDEWDKARDHYTRALALFEGGGNVLDIAGSLVSLGNLEITQKRLDLAEQRFARALQHYETVSEYVSDPESVVTFQEANLRNLYVRYAAVLHDLARHDLARLEDALIMVERGRGHGLARQAAQCRTVLSGRLSSEDASQLKMLQEKLVMADRLVDRAIKRLVLAPQSEQAATRAQVNEARNRYEVAEGHYSVLRSQLYDRYPEYRRLQGVEPLSLTALQALAAQNQDTLFLEWAVVGPTTVITFALSHEHGLQTFVLGTGQNTLTELVSRWHEALIAPGEQNVKKRAAALRLAALEPQRAKLLSDFLLGPLHKANLLNSKRIRRLVCVADGPLLGIPVALLSDATGRRLGDYLTVAVSMSLGVLLWPTESMDAAGALLCVVDPNEGKVIQDPLRGRFPAISFARQQVQRIVSGVHGARTLSGYEAKEAVVKQEMGQYSLLHFATHGWFHARQGLRSGLLLAPEEIDSAEDGFLEAREIINIPLRAKMTVLSACQSGQGQRSRGEGLIGLVWAFHAAGCPSVVASLWNVDDAATAVLMEAFYEKLRQGCRKDEALQQTMQSLRASAGKTAPAYWAHPYFWSGFQIYGDCSPVGNCLQ